MNKTKIDWCDYTWNPVTGCLNTCEYCYARKQSARFSGDVRLNFSDERCKRYSDNLFILSEPFIARKERALNYPFGFYPTLHEYRFDWLEKVKTGSNIFVCSMADLFGCWIPDKWIIKVFEACKKCKQHNYLFLTKNPKRYKILADKQLLPKEKNFWYGSTVTTSNDDYFTNDNFNTFLSIEPILSDFIGERFIINWIIIGAETGNRTSKIIPKKEWIENIIKAADKSKIPVFLKDSLKEIMGNDWKQDYPEQLKIHKMSKLQKQRFLGKCALCRKGFLKKEMNTILYRKTRGESVKTLGYICKDCFSSFKNEFISN